MSVAAHKAEVDRKEIAMPVQRCAGRGVWEYYADLRERS
jgi:hypothetical protein